MAFFSDLAQHVESLRGVLGADLTGDALPSKVGALTDDEVVAVIAEASAVVRFAEKLRITASGVAAARSSRERGHGGLAQIRGHRSPVSLVQELTGSTRADAAKHVRLGESLLAGGAADDTAEASDSATGADDATATTAAPWHSPLGRALLAGTITSAQHDVILLGLGEPPVTCAAADTDADAAAAEHVAQAWTAACEQLIAEAADRTVEELARTARAVRDLLDPDGAAHRFDDRFQRRSFRIWTDADGVRRGTLSFDDLGGAWVRAILDTALRPRRGGPRFVDPDEKSRADDLADDPRTNEQLAYDLLVDILRAGALADAEQVFGARQAGVRVLIAGDDLTVRARHEAAVGLLEEDGTTLPASLIAQQACDTGTVECTIDRDGNPLYLGREQRLFSAKQRLTLALRDGGCRWKGCDRPPSYCEAHHIDEYARDEGRTDIDRGILLCRFHHMQLHHGGWRITRRDLDDFVLNPSSGGGGPIVLRPRLALRYAWGDVEPPPKRFRPAARESAGSPSSETAFFSSR